MAGLTEVRNHFEGVSMLDPDAPRRPVYPVQPYEGRYLEVVALRRQHDDRGLADDLGDPALRFLMLRPAPCG